MLVAASLTSMLQFKWLSAALVDSGSLCRLPLAHSQAAAVTARSKNDKQWLAGTGGRVNGR